MAIPPKRERVLQWSNPLQDVIFRVQADTKIERNKDAKYGQTYLEVTGQDQGYGSYVLCSRIPSEDPHIETWTFVLGFKEQWKYNYELGANLPDQWPTLTQTWVIERVQYEPKMLMHAPPDSTKVRSAGVWTRMGETEVRTQDEALDSLFVILRVTWEDHTIPLKGWEVRQDTGEAFETTTERVPAGTVGSGSDSDGVYSEIVAVNDVWALRVTKTNSGLSTKEPFTDYTEYGPTGEKFPRIREIMTIAEAAGLAQAVDATGKYVTTEQITLEYALVTTQYDPSLVTGQLFTDYTDDSRTGEVFPRQRQITSVDAAAAQKQAVDSNGKFVTADQMTLAKSMVTTAYNTGLATGVEFQDRVLDTRSGRLMDRKRRIVSSSATGQDVNSSGVYAEVEQLTLAKSLLTTSQVTDIIGGGALEWTEWKAFPWPPVLKAYDFIQYPRGNFGFEYDMLEYSGETECDMKLVWTKAPPAALAGEVMLPDTIKWGGAGAFTLKACLHPEIVITETDGFSTYTRTYAATNFVDWPDTVKRILNVEPFFGGFMTTYGTFYKPSP